MPSLRNLPLRLTTGAYILNSGLDKMSISDEGAAQLQEMAASVIPQVGDLKPEEFGKLLATGEMALGSALLLPIVPRLVAGLGLTAFSATLLAIYARTPGMTLDGVRPTREGRGMAKDVFCGDF